MTRDQAYTEIAHVEGAALRLAKAMNRETFLADERALVKHAGITRLIEAKVFTSVTAAEKGIEFDAEFMAHRKLERESVADRIMAEAKYAAAKLRAQLAVELAVGSGFNDDEELEGPSLEQVKESERNLEAALERIDKMLDKAEIIEKGADGLFLGIEARVQIALDSLADVRAVRGAVE